MSKDIKNSDKNNRSEVLTSQSATLFDLADFGHNKVQVNFSLEETSNDGGLLLLQEVDNKIGLTERLASCIQDTRHQSYVKHSTASMPGQRIMQIAAGYEDANDCNQLKDDRILQLCSNNQQPLAVQPTMSRFENQTNSK